MSKPHARVSGAVWVASVFVGVCLVWECLVKFARVPEFVLPPLEEVVANIAQAPMFFLTNALFTISTSLTGFACAAIVGFLISVAIVSSPIAERLLMALLALFNSIPKVALAPLFILWLGTGFVPKVAIAGMMSVLVIVVDTVAGIRSVDPDMLNLAKVHRASRFAVFFKILLPHALPHMFGAWKTAISLSVVGAIVGEYVAGQDGLGSVIVVAQGSFDTPRAFAAVLILGVIATGLFYAVEFLESRAIVWHVSKRFNYA